MENSGRDLTNSSKRANTISKKLSPAVLAELEKLYPSAADRTGIPVEDWRVLVQAACAAVVQEFGFPKPKDEAEMLIETCCDILALEHRLSKYELCQFGEGGGMRTLYTQADAFEAIADTLRMKGPQDLICFVWGADDDQARANELLELVRAKYSGYFVALGRDRNNGNWGVQIKHELPARYEVYEYDQSGRRMWDGPDAFIPTREEALRAVTDKICKAGRQNLICFVSGSDNDETRATELMESVKAKHPECSISLGNEIDGVWGVKVERVE